MPSRILITGAGSGFGREVALRLAKKGHHVIAGVQIHAQMTDLLLEAQKRGVTLTVEKLDITDTIDRTHIFKHEIDILVNNAGIGETGPIGEVPVDIVRRVFEVNIFGTLAITQGFLPQMVERKNGRVIFVSSIAGLVAMPFGAPYCASKHALEAIAGGLRIEVAPYNVSVATINPAMILTGFNDRMLQTWRQWYNPSKNFTKPEDFPLSQLPNNQAEVLPAGMQFDPETTYEVFLDVIENDNGPYRNMAPPSVAIDFEQQQKAVWTQTSRVQP